MSIVTWELCGYPLDDANCGVTVGSTLLASLSPVRTKTTIPGMNGTLPSSTQPVQDERTATLKMHVWGQCGIGFQSEIQRVALLCAQPFPTLTRIVDGVRQTALVELTSLDAGDDTDPLREYTQLTAVFAIPGVWWRGEDFAVRPIAQDGGRIYPGALTVPVDTDHPQGLATMWEGVPDDSPSLLFDSLPLGVFGSAPIPDATIRLPMGVATAAMTDPASGSGLNWSGSPSSSQYTYLDRSSLRAWRSASSDTWDPSQGSDVSGGLDFPAPGPLVINPRPDGSYFLSAVLGGGDGSDILIRFKPSWW